MVSLSLRLPKSLLDWVCTQARTEHTKPTQLIRRWIEERHHSGEPSLEERDARPWFTLDRRLHQDLWHAVRLEEFARANVGGEARACGLCC